MGPLAPPGPQMGPGAPGIDLKSKIAKFGILNILWFYITLKNWYFPCFAMVFAFFWGWIQILRENHPVSWVQTNISPKSVQSKNQKNYKNRSRKIGASIKYEKQKCDLQFAPIGLNELHIEIPSIFLDFLYTTPGPIWRPWGGGQENLITNFDKNLTVRSKIPCTVLLKFRIPPGAQPLCLERSPPRLPTPE